LSDWQNLRGILRESGRRHLRHRGLNWILHKRKAAVIPDQPKTDRAILSATAQHHAHNTRTEG
jgi:hypothetical protein